MASTVSPQTLSYGRRRPVQNTGLSLKADRYRNIIALVMIVTISKVHLMYGFVARLHPALVLVGAACIFAYLNKKYLALDSIYATWPAKVMLGLGIASCLSVPFALSIGHSGLFVVSEYSKVLFFAFLVITAIRTTKDLYFLVWTFVASTGILAMLSIFVFRMRMAKGDDIVRIQNGYSYDSNDIGLVAICGIAMTLLVLQNSRGKLRIWAIACLGMLGMTIARTGSRGALVGLAAVGFGLFIFLDKVPFNKRLGFMFLICFGMIIAAPQGYWEQMQTIFHPTQDYNWDASSGRMEVAKRGLSYFMRNPLTGIGIDNFGLAEGTLSSRAIEKTDDPTMAGVKWSAAHNSFVQVMAEMGLPGIILFASLVFGGIISLVKLRKKLPKHWYKGDPEERFLYSCTVYFPVCMIGFAVGGSFVSFGYQDLIYVMAAFMAGLFVCVRQKMQGVPGVTSPAPTALSPMPPRGGRGGFVPSRRRRG